MIKETTLRELFSAFFRIGLFTVGGGYAMLPMLQKEVVEKYRWATDAELMDYFAIGQSTPGIIAINVATFVGMKKRGLLGALSATLGIVTPSWVIITIIASFFDAFQSNSIIQKAFIGIRIAVVALILSAVIKMGKKAVITLLDLFVVFFAFGGVAFMGVSPGVMIFGIGLFCLFLGWLKEVRLHGTS